MKTLLMFFFNKIKSLSVFKDQEKSFSLFPHLLHDNPRLPILQDVLLLEKSFKKWQKKDWVGLLELQDVQIQFHGQRDKLALLLACGYSQQGQMIKARDWIIKAKNWGCSDILLAQMLVAGLQETYDYAQNLSKQTEVTYLETKKQPFEVEKLAVINLGLAWSGNTVNTVIFRHHAVLTYQSIQVTAFYIDASSICIVSRNLLSGEVKTHHLHGDYHIEDAHNAISLGVDREGFWHLCYVQHAGQLHYRRTLSRMDFFSWTDELKMTGSAEQRVTYPCFILPRGEFPLTLLYRDGGHDRGRARLKSYCEKTASWRDYSEPVFSGYELSPWTANAYWNHPAVGVDGSLHLSFVWRIQGFESLQRVNNVNICYALSMDNGVTWKSSKNQTYQLPITPVNAEVICPIPSGSNLMNQCGSALDMKLRPHIVFYANDEMGVPQYQHVWFDGYNWHKQSISQRKTRFDLIGKGTLRLPMSRPEILVDFDNHVYVIYRADFSSDQLHVLKLSSPFYHFDPTQIQVLVPENLGYYEPIIDRQRWCLENVLTLYLQKAQQPDQEGNPNLCQDNACLIDFLFK